MSTPLPLLDVVRGLYGITPQWDDTDRLVDAVTAAARGGMRLVQLRRKNVSDAKRREQALALRDACNRAGIALIVNDDWRLALDVGADGVHLGRDDGDIAEARKQAGTRLLIGASCYDSLDLARAAIAAGADHVAFGAVFNSPTKPAAVRAPLALLGEARTLAVPDAMDGPDALGLSGASGLTGTPRLLDRFGLLDVSSLLDNGTLAGDEPHAIASSRRPPIVAIGGITPANAALVTAAGADALAVITALFETDDVEAAARELCRAFDVAPFSSNDSKA
jgi:thiamine-phosphate pyrophosphorylase